MRFPRSQPSRPVRKVTAEPLPVSALGRASSADRGIPGAEVLRHAGSAAGCPVTDPRFERHVFVSDMIRRVDVTVEEPPGHLSILDLVAILHCGLQQARRLGRLVGPVRSEVPSRDRCWTVIGGGRP